VCVCIVAYEREREAEGHETKNRRDWK
jgi:hypothetical protein